MDQDQIPMQPAQPMPPEPGVYSPPYPMPQPPPKKPIFKKPWFWIAVIAVIIIIAVAVPKGGGLKDETFGLNQTAAFTDLKVTANEIQTSNGSSIFTPDSGKMYVGVKFTIENTSNKDQIISSLLLFDAYVDGVKADMSFTAAAVFDGGTIDGTVAPGKTLVGYYTMETDKAAKEVELQVKASWLGKEKATFKLSIPADTAADTTVASGDDTAAAAQTTAATEETFGLNQTAELTGLSVTANQIKTSNGTSIFKPADGKMYVGVQFTIVNTSDTDQTISSYLLFDAYVDNVKTDMSISASTALGGDTVDGTLAPGKTLVGYYAMEVDKSAKEVELQVKSSWLGTEKAIFKISIT